MLQSPSATQSTVLLLPMVPLWQQQQHQQELQQEGVVG